LRLASFLGFHQEGIFIKVIVMEDKYVIKFNGQLIARSLAASIHDHSLTHSHAHLLWASKQARAYLVVCDAK